MVKKQAWGDLGDPDCLLVVEVVVRVNFRNLKSDRSYLSQLLFCPKQIWEFYCLSCMAKFCTKTPRGLSKKYHLELQKESRPLVLNHLPLSKRASDPQPPSVFLSRLVFPPKSTRTQGLFLVHDCIMKHRGKTGVALLSASSPSSQK